jgi:hypothetical protein
VSVVASGMRLASWLAGQQAAPRWTQGSHCRPFTDSNLVLLPAVSCRALWRSSCAHCVSTPQQRAQRVTDFRPPSSSCGSLQSRAPVVVLLSSGCDRC